MLRTLFSAVIVVLLCVIAFLLYNNYVRTETASSRKDILAPAAPPAAPTPPAAPPVNPIDQLNREVPTGPAIPAPIAEVVPAEPIIPVVAEVVPPPPPVAPAPVAGHRTHVVQPGDSLWIISRKYYGETDRSMEIAHVNNIKQVSKIRVGQVLILPSAPELKAVEAVVETTEPVEPPVSGPARSVRAPLLEENDASDHEEVPIEVQQPTLNVTRPAPGAKK